jgi:hypothetical protein
LERRRVGIVDVLIALVALVPWRTTVLIALQLSIVLRTFDAYLKWALPILFIAGPLFAYVRDRRAVRPDGSRQPVSGEPRRTRVAVDGHGILALGRKSTETKALRGVGAR